MEVPRMGEASSPNTNAVGVSNPRTANEGGIDIGEAGYPRKLLKMFLRPMKKLLNDDFYWCITPHFGVKVAFHGKIRFPELLRNALPDKEKRKVEYKQ